MTHLCRLLPLAVAPVLFACSDHGFNPTGKDNLADQPAISVVPGLIDYGSDLAEGEVRVEVFQIQSVGGADLQVQNIELFGSIGNFSVLTTETSFVLPPGAAQTIEVAFTPMGALSQMAQVLVSSNDPLNPEALVELVGAGAVPELQIEPDPVDFGTGIVGCDEELDVYLTNVGNDTLVVSSIGYESEVTGVFYELGAPSLPVSIEPGERQQVLLGFLPESVRSYAGSIVVQSNEPLGERSAAIAGAGSYGPEQVDAWEIPLEPPSDIIFLVDQSCSMDDDAVRLGTNFGTFISSLNTYTTDWQIMVVNDDNGCNNSGILTRSTSGYQTTFSNAVRNGGGSYTEALLTVGANAAEKSGSTGCNAGFMRSDAMLHLIMVSDEPEQSSGSWSSYVNRIVAAKGSSSMVRISAIAGPVGRSSCADQGTGYAEAVSATGGIFLDICSEWASATNLAALAEASVSQDTYSLSQTPVVSTIQVFVNGSRVTSGWSYDSASNAVVFSSGVPGEGDQVEIQYSLPGTCD